MISLAVVPCDRSAVNVKQQVIDEFFVFIRVSSLAFRRNQRDELCDFP